MDITITKSEIIDELKRESSLLGKGAAFTEYGVSLYDKLMVYSQEFDVLQNVYASAISTLIDVVCEFLTNAADIVIGNSTTLNLNKNDVSLQTTMKADMLEYIVCSIMTEWLKSTYEKASPIFAERAAAAIKRIEYKLYYKKPPVR